MNNTGRFAPLIILGVLAAAAPGSLRAQAAGEGAALPSWQLSLGAGGILYEGDEATKGGLDILLRLGWNATPRWSFRGEISYFPELKANDVYDYDSGASVLRPGLDGNSTWAAGLAGDALFHLLPESGGRWDPYLVGGLGLLHYEKSRAWRSQTDVPVRAGLGLACRLAPGWAVSVEALGHMTLDKQEFNFIPNAAIAWGPAPRRAAPAVAAGVPAAVPAAAKAAPAPAKPVPADLRAFDLVMNFAENQWQISPEYFMELDAIAKIIRQNPGADVRIEGHVDRLPGVSEKDARRLTEKRANALRDYFVRKHDFPRKRVTAVGLGDTQPKKPNDPAKGNPENRRMVIRIRAAAKTP